MKRWYRWLVVAIVVLTLVPLASCQKGNIGSVKLGQEKIELEFWHTKTGSQEELLNLIVAEFNATNEYNIQVNPTLIEGSYD